MCRALYFWGDGMRRAIFISAGLGDSLLSLPLAKRLQAKGGSLVGILTNRLLPLSLLQKTGYFTRIFFMPEPQSTDTVDWSYYSCLLRSLWSFDEIYFPAFGAQKRNVRFVRRTRGKLLTLSSSVHQRFPQRTVYVAPIEKIHDAVQNLRLADPTAPVEPLTQELIALPPSIQQMARDRDLASITRCKPYIAVQVSTVDLFPQKSWPIAHWQSWIKKVTVQFPSLRCVLVGSQREAGAADTILELGLSNVISTVGTLPLEETMAVLAQAHMLVGLDGGLMHLAASLGTPTFTVWGGSNPILYGYEQMNPRRHRDVSIRPACGPCESWIAPNQIRTSIPRQCPDFMCLHTLTPQMVFDQFVTFTQGLSDQLTMLNSYE